MRPRQSVVLLQGLGEDRTSNFRSEAHPVLRCQNRRRGPGVAVQGHRRTSGLRAPVPGVLPAVRHYQDGQAGRPASRARDFRADIGGRPMTTPDLAARRPGHRNGGARARRTSADRHIPEPRISEREWGKEDHTLRTCVFIEIKALRVCAALTVKSSF